MRGKEHERGTAKGDIDASIRWVTNPRVRSSGDEFVFWADGDFEGKERAQGTEAPNTTGKLND